MRWVQLGRLMLVGMFLSLLVGALGCEGGRGAYRPLRLAPMIAPFESDIPVPMGFRFVEHASEDRATGNMRLYLRHSYQGDAHKLNVRNFYRDEMPLAQWVKVSDGNVKGEYTLRFEKGNESCTVLIRDAMGRGGETLVQVIISQEHRGATPPTARSKR